MELFSKYVQQSITLFLLLFIYFLHYNVSIYNIYLVIKLLIFNKIFNILYKKMQFISQRKDKEKEKLFIY